MAFWQILGQLAVSGDGETIQRVNDSGGFSQVDVQELMTTKDMQAAMKTAASKVSKYAAPNKK